MHFSTHSRPLQFNCLPFGLSCAPWYFSKTLKLVVTILRELGVRLVTIYFGIGGVGMLSHGTHLGLIAQLEVLGFIVHRDKRANTGDGILGHEDTILTHPGTSASRGGNKEAAWK